MNSLKLTSSQLVAVIVAAVLILVGGLLIGQLTPSLFQVQASAEAQQVDGLFYVMLVIGGAIFLLVQGLLIFSVWRFRAKPGDTSDGIHLHGNTTLEIVWTIIPAIIVIVLTILSFNVLNSLQAPRENELVIQTTAARFNWAFSYDAPRSLLDSLVVDPKAIPESVNSLFDANGNVQVQSSELHTYIGRSVRLEMQSRDVIHSFWVPAFRVKQDVIPGRTTSIRFTPILAGEYPIRCAELCGPNHGLMIAKVIVHEDEAAYNAWLGNNMVGVVFPPSDPVVRGKNYLSSNVQPCYTCHTLNDLIEFNWNGNVGPALNGVGDRSIGSRATATGLKGADYIYQAITQPGAYLVPGYGPLMPQLEIPACDLQSIIAYLCTQTLDGSTACTIDTTKFANECGGAERPALISDAPASTTPAEAVTEVAPTSEPTTAAAAPAGDAAVTPTPAS